MRRGSGLPPPVHHAHALGSRGRERTGPSLRSHRIAEDRLLSFGRRLLYRFAAFGLCAALTGWSWWTAQADGYVGLPVNTLGQIIGDLLLMGLIAPLARRDRAGGSAEPETDPTPAALAKAAHIQLLDVGFCFPDLAGEFPGAAGTQAPDRRDSVVDALCTALENNARIELLLPDPDTSAGLDAARRLCVEPDFYRKALNRLIIDLASVSGAVDIGGLELRLYAEPTHISVIRCDGRIWTALNVGGLYGTPTAYLVLDQGSGNARALVSYVNRLYATARSLSSSRTHDKINDIALARACAGRAGA